MVDQMSSNTRDPKARYDIGALDQRVFGLEKAVNDITSAISALGTKIDERSRTPWTTVIAAFGFMLAFMTTVGILAYRPIQSDMERHEQRLDKMQERYIDGLLKQVETLQRAK